MTIAAHIERLTEELTTYQRNNNIILPTQEETKKYRETVLSQIHTKKLGSSLDRARRLPEDYPEGTFLFFCTLDDNRSMFLGASPDLLCIHAQALENAAKGPDPAISVDDIMVFTVGPKTQ